jgi:drug/metabolite transporter (DMT)-like permease
MLIAVSLQVFGAVLLKTLADARSTLTVGLMVAGIGAVLVLNLVRLGVWGLAHSRFPLSTTFPLSSLFFPAMLAVAAAFGDEIGFRQILGAVLITAGAFWLSTRTQQ